MILITFLCRSQRDLQEYYTAFLIKSGKLPELSGKVILVTLFLVNISIKKLSYLFTCRSQKIQDLSRYEKKGPECYMARSHNKGVQKTLF